MKLLQIYYTCPKDKAIMAETLRDHPPKMDTVIYGLPPGAFGNAFECIPSPESGYEDLPLKTVMMCRMVKERWPGYDGILKVDSEYWVRSNKAFQSLDEFVLDDSPIVAGKLCLKSMLDGEWHEKRDIPDILKEECEADFVPPTWITGGCYFLNWAAILKVADVNVWRARGHTYEDCMVSEAVGQSGVKMKCGFVGGVNRP